MSEQPPAPGPAAAEPECADRFPEQIERALKGVAVTAPASQVWQAFGAHGVTSGLYRHTGPLGPRADPLRLAALLRAVDARGDNGVTLSVLVQIASAVPVLGSGASAGSPAADRSGPALAYERALAGTQMVALAATDTAAAGSDLSGLGTEVHFDGDELVVHGGKRWITNACVADQFLVLARHRPGRHFTSFTWVLVPASAPGVTVRAAESDLLTGAATGHIEFDSVRLPSSHLVGKKGRGMAVFARHMGTERLAGAHWAVALTSRVLADTRARLAQRTIAGVSLWHNAAVRQDFGSCLVRVAQLRALCDALGDRVIEKQDLSAGAVLKSAVGLTVDPVLARCAQLQGADGLARSGAQRVRAEASVFGIGGGVTELMLDDLAGGADALLAELRS